MRTGKSLRARRARGVLSRRMFIESLENRALMAGDLYHNFTMPEDVDSSGTVTPLDALIAINRINQAVAGQPSGSIGKTESVMVDVNADDLISPLDALAVIDILNARNGVDRTGFVASRIQSERRIERIERAIESNDLPPGFSVDQVQEILQTLRQGGRPELGDSIENGSLLWMPRGSLASENPIAPGAGDDLQVEPFIAAVAQRLAAFNVSTEVISELSSHIRKSSEAGAPMDKGEVRDYLEGLGVDVDKIMPQPKGVSGPSQPISPVVDPTLVTEPILESIIARLRKAGAANEIIEVISKEISDAIRNGVPPYLKMVQIRLDELGFPWDRVTGAPPRDVLPPVIVEPELPESPEKPERPDRPEPPIVAAVMVTEPVAESLLPRLVESGVPEEIVSVLSTEIWEAINAGRPLSLMQVHLRLRELVG